MSPVDAPLTLGPGLLRNINAESKKNWWHEGRGYTSFMLYIIVILSFIKIDRHSFPGDVSLRFWFFKPRHWPAHWHFCCAQECMIGFVYAGESGAEKFIRKVDSKKKISLQVRKVSQEKEKRTEQRQNWQIHDLKSSNPVPPSTLPTWGTRLIRSGHPRVSIHLG